MMFALATFSCSEDKEALPAVQKEAKGTVWRSGGLLYCHSQIWTERGDTLIPMKDGKNHFHYQGGQKVYVIYEELKGVETGCNNGIACKIIKTELIE